MEKIMKVQVIAHNEGDSDVSSYIRKNQHSKICKKYNKKISKYRDVISNLENSNYKKRQKILIDNILLDILKEKNPTVYNEALEELHEKVCDLIDSGKI